MLYDGSPPSTCPSSSSSSDYPQYWSSSEDFGLDCFRRPQSSASLSTLGDSHDAGKITFLQHSDGLTACTSGRRSNALASLAQRPSTSSQTHGQSKRNSLFDSFRIPPVLARATTSSPTRRPISLYASEENNPRPISPTDSERNLKYTGRDQGVIGAWFNGKSAPVHLGVTPSPHKEGTDMESYFSTPTVFTGDGVRQSSESRVRRNSTSQQLKSRFSWFGSKPHLPAPTPLPEESEDPLLSLDVEAVLFPTGPVDRLAPSSYNDLLMNAEAIILRLQAAYKLKTEALQQMEGEKAAQQDEAEEAQTRSRHLKIQLDDMAAKSAEQHKAMQVLADELAIEKMRRLESLEEREQCDTSQRSGCGRHVRNSSGSSTSEGDSGFESDDERRSRPGDTDTACTTPEREDQSCELPLPNAIAKLCPSSGRGPPNHYRWLSGYLKEQREDWMRERTPTHGDSGGATQRAVRSMVNSLRSENQRLQGRVEELERTVEGCLDLVSGLRI